MTFFLGVFKKYPNFPNKAGKALHYLVLQSKKEHCVQTLECTYLQVTQSSRIGVRCVSVCGASHFYVS